MIKVNLLDSVTDRSKGVVVVNERTANPRAQTTMLALAIGALLLVALGFEYWSANRAHDEAQKELERQQQIAKQMAEVNKEQADLEKKTKDIEARIEAIQKLRQAQMGPGTVLREIKDRLDGVPNLYLESVEQKGSDLVIKGDSPNEAAVAQFGRSLEFSSGLFGNLNIETQRKTLEFSPDAAAAGATADAVKVPKPETINFTIKCSYKPTSLSPQPPATATANAANQVAQK